MESSNTIRQRVEPSATGLFYFGQQLWWSGALALLAVVGAWAYVFPQVYFASNALTFRDWVVAVLIFPISLVALLMVFGRLRSVVAAPVALPPFFSATRQAQRLHDRMIAFDKWHSSGSLGPSS